MGKHNKFTFTCVGFEVSGSIGYMEIKDRD